MPSRIDLVVWLNDVDETAVVVALSDRGCLAIGSILQPGEEGAKCAAMPIPDMFPDELLATVAKDLVVAAYNEHGEFVNLRGKSRLQ